MTTFAADLHIHSRFSRATSKGLTVRSLAAWAAVKGISVLGTGDLTHPGWLEEIGRELVEDGSGLLSLRQPANLADGIPGLSEHLAGHQLSGGTRFMLQGEISSIYKRGGRVRKVHNLVYLPTLEAAHALNLKLAQVGNLASDGRPILGLDSRILLDMVLSTHPEAFLVPAHIWTPWFSLFGSMSGFDSVEECFGDLAGEIFALETGLSSDPGMNWTISALDRFRMVSNSDAHSGEKLAREANLFRGAASFSGIRAALKDHGTREAGCEFLGTVEFFPEEGKYHLDGHRKCNWAMEPGETAANRGLCPVCGKPATLGVLHRVLALADRPEPQRPEGQPGYDSLIPLKEVLSEILDTGAGSKKVTSEYFRLITTLGPELFILREAGLPDIRRASPVLAEAVERMRAGKVLRKSGYDGEFGVITVFTPEERAEMRHGGRLVATQQRRKRALPAGSPPAKPEPADDPEPGGPEPAAQAGSAATRPDGLNQAQALAVYAEPGPTLVLAGPGTGKTHTLIRRVERLLADGVPADALAVVTFTRRAAGELSERLAALRGEEAPQPLADTLHALALALWSMRRGQPPVLLSEDAAKKLFLEALPETLTKAEREALFRRHALARETLLPLEGPDGELTASAQAEVAEVKAVRNLADFTDLIEFLLDEVSQPGFSPPFAHLLVDEIQDLSVLQLEAVLGFAGQAGHGFFAIGDPNQSIYGFRGAATNVQQRLAERWPGLTVLALAENFRSGQGILDAAQAVISGPLSPQPRLKARPGAAWELEQVEAPDARLEARLIAERARKLLGSTSLTLLDTQGPHLAPGDIAVLVRFRALIPPLKAALEQAGLPCSAPEAEVFWEDPRVAAILRVAEKLFGLPASASVHEGMADNADDGADGAAQPGPVAVNLPEFLLLQGPRVLPAALRESPPFDRFFWQGPAFRDLCHEFEAHGGWVGLIDWLRLQAGLAEIRQSAQKVRLMTLHAAKGLEFEAVFLPALEEGILPFAGFGGNAATPEALAPEVLAEERRLFYVGLTRARRFLCLSFARERMLYGRTLAQHPSRLLADLPREFVRRRQITQKVQSKQTHLSLF